MAFASYRSTIDAVYQAAADPDQWKRVLGMVSDQSAAPGH